MLNTKSKDGYPLTWEETVQWLYQHPDQAEVVRACYLDDPLIKAAQRFAESQEWKATRQLMPRKPGQVLDLGAGRGISSFALARDGWRVVALEPNPSSVVGSTAIYTLAKEFSLEISVVRGYGETLGFSENAFDLVYARQVLHHSRNLTLFCRQVAHVVKPGGRFIAVREHVISKPDDLNEFLASHPFHRFHGEENAFTLEQYLSAIENSGFRILKVLGPFDTVINYYPMSDHEWYETCIRPLVRRIGYIPVILLTSQRHVVGRFLLRQLAMRLSASINTPGRMYSFVAEKPA